MVEWFRRHVRHGVGVVFLLGLFLWPSFALATTQVGNVVLQAWYRQRHTFHTDGGDHIQWSQFRNELFGWLVYDDIVEDGLLFNRVKVPLVKYAVFNARYRFRYDPVYQIKDHFDNLYNGDEKDNFIIPENGFLDITLDLDFEKVGPGNLSLRIGQQQIVWGESDLYRSLDIINPLRIDQNGPVGEKFDEFRSPIWAAKILYDIGTIGTLLSDVAIEPWFTPRMRDITTDLLLEDGFRLPARITACLDESGNEIPFEIGRCSQVRSPTGERVFVQQRPSWVGQRRKRHPWSIFAADGNSESNTIDFACITQTCSADQVGERASAWVNLVKSRDAHVLKGSGRHSSAGGIRVLAKTFFNLDFSINYLFLKVGTTGAADLNKTLVPYGDADVNATLDTPFDLEGNFEEGLRRCVADSGNQHETQSKGRGARVGTILVGADLRGYNHPDRFQSNNPNGALDGSGNPVPGRHHSTRVPYTFCVPAMHDILWTHVVGLTATYNDFKYTGAVFRFEQSFSSKEPIRPHPTGVARRFTDTPSEENLRNNFIKTTRVWRSMVGFDMVQAFDSLKYIPFMPKTMYQNSSFFTGQWLMENYWDNRANSFCQNTDHLGIGLNEKEARATGVRGARGDSGCRRYRWNHLLTFAWAGYGFFGGRLETRNAIVMEPRSRSMLLFTQNWWRNLFGYRALEASFGVGWYPGSGIRDDWTGLSNYQSRDQFWFEMTYYIL